MASVEIMLRFKEKDGEKKNKKAAFTVAWMKLLLSFQAQKTTQERIRMLKGCLHFVIKQPLSTVFLVSLGRLLVNVLGPVVRSPITSNSGLTVYVIGLVRRTF